MAYTKTDWKDHIVETPNKYNQTANGDGTVTLTAVPGAVVQQGTPLSAENLNKMEQGIESAEQAAEGAKAYTDQQIQLVTETGIPKLVSYQYELTAAADGQTDFNIPLATFDKNNDTVLLIQNRTLLQPSAFLIDDFDLDGTFTIRLDEGIDTGQTLHLVILKNVPMGPDGAINGAVLAAGSIPLDRLAEAIEVTAEVSTIADAGEYFTSPNTEGALQEIGQVLNGMNGELITRVNNILGV